MEYRRLGRTGLKISKVSLGTMAFGRWIDENTSAQILDKSLGLGINLIDTADVYGKGMDNGNFDQLGESETILGNILKQKRNDVLISTKLNNRMGPLENDQGQSRYHIFRAIEASLERLQTDYIDILHVHRFDPNSRFEESLRALDDLITQGKVRYIACSNFAAWQVAKAHGISMLHHFARYESIQIEYSLISRQIEDEIIPFAESEEVGILAYSPLGRGILTGKYSAGNPPPLNSRLASGEEKLKDLMNQKNIFEYVDALDKIAKQKGWNLPQLAFNWVANHPSITSAILGASKVVHLEDTLKHVDDQLSTEELSLIDKAYQVIKS